ncbi:substrate-binding domain-containing protein, partial [bacterium]|nr:substrate-binding domain-containing protein [bacterium]
QRFKAWKDTLQSAGIESNDNHWVEGNWSSASGYEVTQQLFQKYPEMDAIFAANDQMALGALTIVHQKRLRVPQDFGIVGFDNIPESEHFWPALTTVQHDQHQVGTLAVHEIVRIIESFRNNESPEYKTILLTPNLLVRNSSLK